MALWLGILVLPIVFAWFTLKKDAGYTSRVRIISLSWMVLWAFYS
jgi:hypothetical protein